MDDFEGDVFYNLLNEFNSVFVNGEDLLAEKLRYVEIENLIKNIIFRSITKANKNGYDFDFTHLTRYGKRNFTILFSVDSSCWELEVKLLGTAEEILDNGFKESIPVTCNDFSVVLTDLK